MPVTMRIIIPESGSRRKPHGTWKLPTVPFPICNGMEGIHGATVTSNARASSDPAELQALWEGWHAVGRPMAADYARLVALANEGARELGYRDTGVLWRSWYDMPPDEFATFLRKEVPRWKGIVEGAGLQPE